MGKTCRGGRGGGNREGEREVRDQEPLVEAPECSRGPRQPSEAPRKEAVAGCS